jgi:iron complex outermembrane recepter protein
MKQFTQIAILSAGVAFIAPAVYAQSAPSAPNTAAASDKADIVITAQRREQRLQDVGIAVSVLSKKDLAAFNIKDTTDIARAIPNLHFNAYGSSQVVFNIRGVSQNDYGDQQEPPVAVYQDDSYASSITVASFPVFDLSRVEALRGPQGTLFGRNATGGAVQFISNQPTKTLQAYLSGTYGSFNQTTLEAGISGPLTDELGFRISGIIDKDDGYIHNITPGQPDRGSNNHWALRGIFTWNPDPSFKTKLTLRYTQADKERQAGNYTLAPACPNAQYQGEFLAANQVCGYWQNYYGVNYNGGVAGSTANGYTNPSITPSQGGNPWSTAGTGDAYVNRKLFSTTLRSDASLGKLNLTSITDYTHLNKFYIEGGDGVPELPYVQGTLGNFPGGYAAGGTGACAAPAQSTTCYLSGTIFYQGANTDQYSQEFRASVTAGKNYLVLGAYGLVINGDFYAKYATPFDGYDPYVTIKQDTKSFAFFGQDELKLSDQFKLIGGLRYWHDAKRGTYDASEAYSGFQLHWGPDNISWNDPSAATTPAVFNYNTAGKAGLAASGINITPAAANPNFSGYTARAEIDYKPSRNVLAYLSYNRGSKSGGFTFSTGTPVLGQPVIDTVNNIPYKPETLNSYEAGLKTTLAPGTTFNLTAFYYDYQNYQAFVQVGYTQVVRNLSATNKGLEAELASHPLKGLTLNINAAWQDSEVKNVLLPDGATLVNHNLPQAPGFAGNVMARYEFDMAGGKASVQGDSLYQSKTCFTVMCAPVEQEAAYHVENLRIGFSPKGGKLDFAAYVNNVNNRAYRLYAFDGSAYWGDVLGVYAKPRTYGVTATMRFGN